MAVPYLVKGDALVTGTERVWWDGQLKRATRGRNYDIALDGKRVVAVQDAYSAYGAKTPGQITAWLCDRLGSRNTPELNAVMGRWSDVAAELTRSTFR